MSVLGLALVVARPAAAQNIFGGIRGTVVDTSSAMVAHATVTSKETRTGYTRTTETDSAGGYVFSLLPIGTYNLTVEMKGFKTFVQTGVTLNVNQVAGVNVTLELGAVSQSVEVKASEVIVNTQTSEVGRLVTSTMISELPLNTRNPVNLATLSASVTRANIPHLGARGQHIHATGPSRSRSRRRRVLATLAPPI